MKDPAVIVILAGLLCWAEAVVAQAETNGTSEPMMWQSIYQATLGKSDGDRCPMSPSCSAYAEQAIRKHGWFVGWMMTFDRFGHEGTEAQLTANGVRYRDGKLKAIDEVEHNDFWWYGSKPMTLSQLTKAGEAELSSALTNVPPQAAIASDETMREAGKTLLRVGAPDQAAILFVTLWSRSKNPADALFGALSFLEADNPAACVALLDTILDAENVNKDDKVIALFAQGLAFRKRELFDAAAESFGKARDLATDESAVGVIRAYYVEANLKADKWTDAAKETEDIETSTAKAIRREMTEDLPWRSPALSGTMSAILPGAGQTYCGRYQEGFWAFVVCSAFAFASYEAFDNDLEWVGAATTLTGLSWYSGNIYGAIGAAHKYNRREKDIRILNWIERLGVQQDKGALKVMLKYDF